MSSSQSDTAAAFLAEAIAAGASSDQVADLIAAACNGIGVSLTPIVGVRGVAALFRRSLHLAGLDPAGVAAAGVLPQALDVEALRTALAQRSSADAAAAGLLLLKTFHALLAKLIGASLTERLLRPVWANLWSADAARDAMQ